MRSLYITKLLGSNKVIRALTLSDFSTWSSSSISAVIFTLFAINSISGATITDVGFSSLVFLVVSALLNVPLGRLLDKMKGYIDETYILSLSSIVRGVGLILLAYSTQLWQLYLFQAILGIARSMNYVSWRALFSKYLEPGNVAEQWGMYDTVIAVGLGVATLIGGYLGDTIPFNSIILIAGITALVGAIFPLFVINEVKDTKEN